MARLFRRNGANGRNASVQRNDGARGRVENLDELLKLNKGGFSAFAEDVGEQPAYLLPFGRTSRQLASEMPVLRQPVNIPQSQPIQMPESEPMPEAPQGEDFGDVSTAQEFINVLNQAYGLANPYTGYQQPEGIMSTQDGGTLFSDGIIYYPDGTYRFGDPSATAIASNAEGGVRYSDGSVRQSYSQQQTQNMSYAGGLGGLMQGIFGGQQDITQQYGAYNPIEPTPGNLNLGTDIRTRDLPQNFGFKLPIGAQVVEVYNQAQPGSGGVGNMENRGYGNSILLRLPSGEMVRFSHLDQVGNYKPGDRIQPGETFGVPGATGNVTGEHLDLEFYNKQGQIADPSTFSGFNDTTSLYSPEAMQMSSPDNPQTQPQQAQMQQPQIQQPQQVPTPATDLIQNTARTIQNPLTTLPEQTKGQIASGVATTGQKLGIPEVQASEVLSGQATPGEALSRNIEQYVPKTGIDTGLSELLRGDIQGAKQNFLDTAGRIGSRLQKAPGQIASEIVKPAYADDGSQKGQLESIGQNISGAVDSVKEFATRKAGEGISAIKQGISGLFGSRQKPELSDIGQKRAVGEVSGASDVTSQGSPVTPTLDSAKALQGQQLNDIRDPFFKTGQVEQFKNYLTPGAEQGQQLTYDIFKPDFFETAKTGFRDVFGGTSLEAGAEEKYTENRRQMAQELKNRIISEHGDPLQYRAEEVRAVAQSIPDILPEDYTPPSVPHHTPSLQDYLNAGKTPAQWYAEIRGQGELDRLAGDPSLQYDPRSGTIRSPFSGVRKQADAPEPVSMGDIESSQSRGYGGQRATVLPSGRYVQARPGQKLAVSGGEVQSYDPKTVKIGNEEIDLGSPTKTVSAQPSFSFTRRDEPGMLNKFLGFFRR